MKLRHLKIARFRGIKALDWFLQGDFICLLGPGDSCKSTILDAIELVLSPRWNVMLDDADFFDADTSEPIVIEATIGNLPRRLLSDDRFGLKLRGYCSEGPTIHDEPKDGDEEAVTIRLSVDSSLEPQWHVVAERHPQGVPISAKDRERLGVTRLGAVIDRHLSWSRGSALATLTGEFDEHAQLLADARRHARSTVDPTKLPRMTETATAVAQLARKFGVAPRHQFEPRIDPGGATETTGLALHDGLVPVRRSGMGTRRLLTLAIQRHLSKDGGVTLVDEVEHGLEPYRLRRLLTELLAPPSATTPKTGAPVETGGVIILTTHSTIALGQLRAEHLRIVRTDAAAGTVIAKPSAEAQGSLITHAEAFLSRKVVVCEGPTELGLLVGLDRVWSEADEPFAVRGVGLANAGGASKVADLALEFRRLGYHTLVLADSDEPLKKTPAELQAAGVVPLLWSDNLCTEQRLFLDLPWAAIAAAVQFALDDRIPVRDQLASVLGESAVHLDPDPSSWPRSIAEPNLRIALGKIAKNRNSPWFKNARSGARLGELVAKHLEQIPSTDLAQKINSLRQWVFNDDT